jgi:phosphate-selective porin OprO/OprP
MLAIAAALHISAAPAHAQSSAGAPSAPETPRTFGWEDHPTIHAGRHLRMELRFRIQDDWRDTNGPLPAGESTFRIPLKRAGVRGQIGGAVEFQIDRELVRDDGWRDAYVNVRWRPAIHVRAGQFKLPFSLDENTPLTALDFMYRARAARQLAPGRDPGVMAHGRLPGGVRYEAGAFIRDGRNARRPGSDRVQGQTTFAARVRLTPLGQRAGLFRSLDLGIAGVTSHLPDGLPALRGRTALDATFFSSDRTVGGRRHRVGVELAWHPGRFALKSEYVRVRDGRPGERAGGALESTGWYVSAVWVATGETKAAGALAPARPLHRGGPGAVELAARLESLGFRDGSLPPSVTRIGTAGVNWILNRWVRLQFNVMRERLDRPSSSRFWHRVFRVQLVL